MVSGETDNRASRRPRAMRRTMFHRAARRMAHSYQRADRTALRLASRVIPADKRQVVRAHRELFGGNIHAAVPIGKSYVLPVVIPDKLKYLRHAVIPLALLVTLLVIFHADAALTGYGGTHTVAASTVKQSAAHNGSLYSIGASLGTVDFAADYGASDPRSSGASGNAAYITKTVNGSYGWTRLITDDASTITPEAVYAGLDDTAGSEAVFVTGHFTGTVDFAADFGGSADEKTAIGTRDGFVTRINADGSYGWTYTFGYAGATVSPTSITHDPASATPIVAGSFAGTMQFDAVTGERINASGNDGFVLWLTDGGTTASYLRDYHVASSVRAEINDITPAGADLIMGGTYDTGAVFEMGQAEDTAGAAGGYEGFVLRLLMDGSYAAHQKVTGTGAETVSHVYAQPDGTYYFLGAMTSAATITSLGSTAVHGSGAQDLFIVETSSANVNQWAHTFGADGATLSPSGFVVAADGTVTLAGQQDAVAVNFAEDFAGSDVLTPNAASEASSFITVFRQGEYIDAYLFGAGVADDPAGDLAVSDLASSDPDELLYITGTYTETMNFAAALSQTDNKSATVDGGIFTTALITSPLRTISATGLQFFDSEGTNLSSSGTQELAPLVSILDDDSTHLADIAVDMTDDRTWTTTGDSDLAGYRSVIANLTNQSGATGTFTFYVPYRPGDAAVAICPGAAQLSDVSANCAGRETIPNGGGASIVERGGSDYWEITNRSDVSLGGVSLVYPGIVLSEPAGGLSVTEGTSAVFQVALRTAPTSDVTITPGVSDGAQLSNASAVTFTSENWQTPQDMIFGAIDDDYADGPVDVDVSLALTSVDAAYNGASEPPITLQVLDNDTAGISWSPTSLLLSESGSGAQLCVTLTAEPTGTVTLGLSSSDTSEATTDSSLVIAAADWDQASNCVTVTPIDDNLIDGSQDAVLSVTSVESTDSAFAALVPGNLATVTAAVQDDDEAGFVFSVSGSGETTEAGGTIEVCATLTAQPTAAVTVPVSTSDSSEGTLGSSAIVIEVVDWNTPNLNCAVVTGQDDNLIDGDIAYSILTGDPSSDDANWGDFGEADTENPLLSNLDNDVASVNLSTTALTITEGAAVDTFDITIGSQPAPGQEVVLDISSTDSGQFNASPSTITFTNSTWAAPQTITVTAVDDALLEGNHSGSVNITVDTAATSEPPYDLLSMQTANVAITDNDQATVSIAAGSNALENTTDSAFTVTLSKTNNTNSGITVAYGVLGTSTAVADTHFTTLSGNITIAPGQNSAEIAVDAASHDNEVFGGNRTLQIELIEITNNANVTVGSPDTATVLIQDDESPAVSLSATPGTEGASDIVLTATLSLANETGDILQFGLTNAGGTALVSSDYADFAGASVSIANSAATGTHTIVITDDSYLEQTTETVIAALDAEALPTGVAIDSEAADATVTITDNDDATMTVTASGAAEPSTAGSFTVALDHQNETGSAITADFTTGGTAASGSDFIAISSSATIANGESTAIVTLTPIDDVDIESDETVTLDLTTTSFARATIGAPAQATLTIADNETAGVTVTLPDDTTGEDGATGQVCFELASRPAADVTIALSSTDSSRVSVPTDVTIARDNWSTPTCITATGQDDSPPVVTGTIDITIITGEVTSADTFYNALGASDIADATVHHVDNDVPSVTVQAVSTVTSEDGAQEAVVRFSLSSEPASSVTIPVSISDATEGNLNGVTSIIIAPSDWNSPSANQLTIYGQDDALVDGTVAYTLTTGAASSSDSNYNAFTVGDVGLTNEDDDMAGVSVDISGDTAVEGASLTHTVAIASQPAGAEQVIITATPTNDQIALDGSEPGEPVTLTFTNANWAAAQGVTVLAIDDSLLELAHTSAVTYAVADTTTDPAYEEYTISPATYAVNITDNDTATATLSAANADEDASMVFTVTLDKPNNSGSAITFDFSTTVSGSAAPGDDFTAVAGGTISVANGSSTGTLAVTIADDDLLEDDETLAAQITSSSAALVTIVGADASATIIDNDTATATIAATDSAAAENPADNGQFTVTLNKVNNTPSAIAVSYSVSGSATATEDYAALSGTATIAAGQNSAAIAVDTTSMDDELVEGDETVTVTLTATDQPLTMVSSTPATVTITDDDSYAWSITTSTNGLEAGPQAIVLTISLNHPNGTGDDMTVILTDPITGNTATSAQDYTVFGGTVAIPDGETEATVTIPVTDDELLETTEQFSAIISAPSEGDIDSASAIATITDNDAAAAALSVTTSTESEDLVFTTTLDKVNNTGSALTFDFETSDGTALSGSDYTSSMTTISIPSGASTGVTTVLVIDDSDLEGDETLTGTISNGSSLAVTIAEASSVATITDNETATATISATTPTATENPSSDGSFTISIGTPNMTGAPITISFAVSGSATPGDDYTSIGTNAVIAPTASNTVINVETGGYDDAIVEGDETIVATLSSTSAPALVGVDASPATVTITDDDSYVWNIAEQQDGAETDSVPASFRVSLNHTNTSGAPMTITLTTSGTATSDADFTAPAATATIPDGSDYADISVAVIDDALLESPEDISMTLSAPSEGSVGTAMATATIADNDTANAVLTTSNMAENAGDITFTATLDKANDTNAPITFSLDTTGGTATAGIDYAALSAVAVSIPIGSLTASVTADVADDALLEGDETVTATLSASSNPAVTISTATATATILDNETATASVVATTPSVLEDAAAPGTFTVSLSRVNNTPAPINISYSVSGTAVADEDYVSLSGGSIAIAIGASTATISVDATDDIAAESAETITVTLDSSSAPSLVTIGGQNEATMTIVDNDTLSWAITKLDDGSEQGAEDIVFRVQLSQSNSTGGNLTATITDQGSGSASIDDYTAFGDSITIAPNADYADIHVPVADDTNLERSETVVAVLGDVSEGDIAEDSATALIIDNDTALLNITATESAAQESPAANGQFTISLDKPNESTLPIVITYSVSGSATGGTDYALLSGTANIPAGEQSTLVWVDMASFNDTLHETDETVVLILTATDHSGVALGPSINATVTILSDDPQPSTPTTDDLSTVTSRPSTIYIPLPESAGGTADPETSLPAPATPPVDQIAPDQDADGVDDSVEAKANNFGDGNGDGIPDNLQANVSSLVSAVTGRPVTLAAMGDCREVQSFAVLGENELEKSDLTHRYPEGLIDYRLGCPDSGLTASVTVYYDQELDGTYSWRKLATPTLAFDPIDSARLSKHPVGEDQVTTVSYLVTDGGSLDDDGKADGKIIDPAGLAVTVFRPADLWWIAPVLLVAGALIARAAVHHHREHLASKAKIARF